jgi:hypothetical protein
MVGAADAIIVSPISSKENIQNCARVSGHEISWIALEEADVIPVSDRDFAGVERGVEDWRSLSEPQNNKKNENPHSANR